MSDMYVENQVSMNRVNKVQNKGLFHYVYLNFPIKLNTQHYIQPFSESDTGGFGLNYHLKSRIPTVNCTSKLIKNI